MPRVRTLSPELQEALDEMKRLRQEIQDRAKELFKAQAQALFAKYPQLENFAWAQYTDYFNDGDQCHFYVRDYSIEVNGQCIEDLRYGSYRDITPEQKALLTEMGEAVDTLINAFDKQDMQAMFGDHVKVTVTPNGYETEYYEHD